MQTGNSVFPPPPTHNQYQNVYHTHPSAYPHHDHDLKRQYLTLLPPQQIIDLCLNFDFHTPPYIKSSLWPPDINAAIANLKKTAPVAENDREASSSENAVMGSLANNSTSSGTQQQQEKPPNEPEPPDKESSSTVPPPSTPTVTNHPADPNAITTQPQPPQSAYPHQPYSYQPQTSYPHAPYYSLPPGYAQYPQMTYPPYNVHNGYLAQQPSSYPPPPNQLYSLPPPASQPMPPDPSASDDLPSYEEMIAEALADSGDPEGCAPKDLFTWMASRYPLQSNFRPSASQALQKAYKRGRFEKSSGGKYRLNATWEGGSSSRRTTRRPQVHNHVPQSTSISAPPFTHAPLIQKQSQPGAPYQPPYGYSYPPHGFPSYPHQPQSQPPLSDSMNSDKPLQAQSEVADAYEAAQNILKAINFGALLSMPNGEDGSTKNEAAVPNTENGTSAPTTDAGMATLGEQPTESGAATNSLSISQETNPRAELQAQLALLAAQLAELAQESDPQAPAELNVSQQPLQQVIQTETPLQPLQPQPIPPKIPPPILTQPLQSVQVISSVPEEEEDSSDDDMEEVI